MRSAFMAAQGGGRQVAILAPTTLLVQQHFQQKGSDPCRRRFKWKYSMVYHDLPTRKSQVRLDKPCLSIRLIFAFRRSLRIF
ncbi:MAG: hypothetical protein KJ558_05890, partial [Gammaproteobacteria bacterium]|nr:hypothetical protein [Gammaproteobacteria bacterium]MBU1654348.1 hypothetical protein [Gammaproteobacteria bacterium]MBU1962666.1 hypothetical protein [Gammaproteobacteria bacterium]